MTRLDHVQMTVRDLDAAVAFFALLGLEADGPPQLVEGAFVEAVTGVPGARSRIVMMRLPGADTTVEVSSFLSPACTQEPAYVPVTALGLRSIAFEVDDLAATLEVLATHGYGLVHEVAEYEGVYRLCYVKGPEGVIVMLAQRLV